MKRVVISCILIGWFACPVPVTAEDIGMKAGGPLQVEALKWARDEGYAVGVWHGRTVYCKTFPPQPALGHYGSRKVLRRLSELEADYTRYAGLANDAAGAISYGN